MVVANRSVRITPPQGAQSRSPMAAGRWKSMAVLMLVMVVGTAVPRLAIAAGIVVTAAADGDDDDNGRASTFSGVRVRRRPQEQPFDDISWSNLRRFVCGGADNEKCMNDDRFNQLNPEFLHKLSARFNQFNPTEALPDTNMITMTSDSVPEMYSNDVNIWNSLNLSGRREGPFYVDEPDYVLTKEERTEPVRIFDYVSDPFIPQRGRREPFALFAHKRPDPSSTSTAAESYGGRTSVSHRMKPNRETRTLSMTTHFNGCEKTSSAVVRGIHQAAIEQRNRQHNELQEHQQPTPPQLQQQHYPTQPTQARYYDRVDDNANFRRFLRHLLTPDNSTDNDIAIADGKTNFSSSSAVEDGPEPQSNQAHRHQQQQQQNTIDSLQPIPSHHNLSPATAGQPTATDTTTTAAARHSMASQRSGNNMSRDTFYLARGSHQPQSQ